MVTSQQLQRLKEGDRNAFEAIYRAYNARIYNFVFAMVKNRGVAKDITQDIFLLIWEKKANIEVGSNFEGYLFKVSQNMVYHTIKRDLLLQDYIDKQTSENPEDSFEIGDEIDSLFFEEFILKVLKELPPSRREIFMLYWKSGFNYREIADKLNISEKTVATQIHRSLDFLRDKLGIIAFSVLIANNIQAIC